VTQPALGTPVDNSKPLFTISVFPTVNSTPDRLISAMRSSSSAATALGQRSSSSSERASNLGLQLIPLRTPFSIGQCSEYIRGPINLLSDLPLSILGKTCQ
jgi:hypothetical protein